MENTTAQETVLTASPIKGEALVLNEENYNSLLTMLKSSDEADHKMAQLILNGCDIPKSIYWIWQLGRYGWYTQSRMVNLRTKASRNLRDISDLFRISAKDPTSFAVWLKDKGWLTPEIFQYLEEDVINKHARQFRNTFYDVEFKIKEEYKHLASKTETLTLKILE